MKLLEILTTSILSLTLVSSSEPNPDEVAVSSASTQTGYRALPSSELLSLLKDAMSKNDPNQARTLLENHVPISQSLDETLQQTFSNSSTGTSVPSSVNEFDTNTIISVHGTLLHWAADRGHSDLLPVLIIRGADIDLKCGQLAMTPLMLAVRNGHDAVVAQLLNALATQPERMHNLITTLDNGDRSALHYAALGSHEVVIAQLLDAFATQPERMHSLIMIQSGFGWTALHCAAQRGHGTIVAQLLNALATHPVHIHGPIMAQDRNGWAALHHAASNGHDVVVALLLNALAADPERKHSLITIQDSDGWNALYYASINSKTSTVKMLLEHYKETIDKIALNASSSAAGLSSTCTDFASLVDREGKALDLAITHDCAEIIDLLAQLGANLDVRDENGDINLHRAARAGRSAVVTALVANRAESQRNNAGNTPHDVAQGLTPEAMNLLEECAGRIIMK